MGTERTKKLNPIRTMSEKGIVISFGSDAPCTTPDPIVWMDKAVNNPNTEQCISIQDALKMCTYNGYYTSFDEDIRGSLEVGKKADMVILSENIYNAENISKVRVEQLILNGKKYKSCSEKVIKAVICGLFSKNKF